MWICYSLESGGVEQTYPGLVMRDGSADHFKSDCLASLPGFVLGATSESSLLHQSQSKDKGGEASDDVVFQST